MSRVQGIFLREGKMLCGNEIVLDKRTKYKAQYDDLDHTEPLKGAPHVWEPHMSYSLNSLKVVVWGVIQAATRGV